MLVVETLLHKTYRCILKILEWTFIITCGVKWFEFEGRYSTKTADIPYIYSINLFILSFKRLSMNVKTETYLLLLNLVSLIVVEKSQIPYLEIQVWYRNIIMIVPRISGPGSKNSNKNMISIQYKLNRWQALNLLWSLEVNLVVSYLWTVAANSYFSIDEQQRLEQPIIQLLV